jgi:hypothetical protein
MVLHSNKQLKIYYISTSIIIILYTSVQFMCKHILPLHCKKKVGDIPVPSRDVSYQTLLGRE